MSSQLLRFGNAIWAADYLSCSNAAVESVVEVRTSPHSTQQLQLLMTCCWLFLAGESTPPRNAVGSNDAEGCASERQAMGNSLSSLLLVTDQVLTCLSFLAILGALVWPARGWRCMGAALGFPKLLLMLAAGGFGKRNHPPGGDERAFA